MRGLGAGARYSRAHRARSPLGRHIGQSFKPSSSLVKVDPFYSICFFSKKQPSVRRLPRDACRQPSPPAPRHTACKPRPISNKRLPAVGAARRTLVIGKSGRQP